MGYVRLSKSEAKALKNALVGFEGEAYVFGSRLDLNKRGGDIDILLKPNGQTDKYRLKTQVSSRFERELEQSLDVVVYDEKSIFCKEVMRHAQPLDLTRLS